MGPVFFSELLEDNGSSSFTETMDQIMQKLSGLNDTAMIEIKNFEQLLGSLKQKAEAESSNPAGKVAMVDSLVSQFISGNSLRAQAALARPAKPNPATLRAKEVLANFEIKLKGLEDNLGGYEGGKRGQETTTELSPVEQPAFAAEKLRVAGKQADGLPARTARPLEQLLTSTLRTKDGYDFNIGSRPSPSKDANNAKAASSTTTTASTSTTTGFDTNTEDVETFENTLLPRLLTASSSSAVADALELQRLLRLSTVGEVKAALMLNAASDPDQTARLLADLFEYQEEDAPGERHNTVAEIRDMISKDLDSVTDAFADLIMKKKQREQKAVSTSTAVLSTGNGEEDPKAVDEEFPREPFDSDTFAVDDGGSSVGPKVTVARKPIFPPYNNPDFIPEYLNVIVHVGKL